MFINCPNCSALVATDLATDLPPERCPRCGFGPLVEEVTLELPKEQATGTPPEPAPEPRPEAAPAAEPEPQAVPASDADPEPHAEPAEAPAAAARPAPRFLHRRDPSASGPDRRLCRRRRALAAGRAAADRRPHAPGPGRCGFDPRLRRAALQPARLARAGCNRRGTARRAPPPAATACCGSAPIRNDALGTGLAAAHPHAVRRGRARARRARVRAGRVPHRSAADITVASGAVHRSSSTSGTSPHAVAFVPPTNGAIRRSALAPAAPAR